MVSAPTRCPARPSLVLPGGGAVRQQKRGTHKGRPNFLCAPPAAIAEAARASSPEIFCPVARSFLPTTRPTVEREAKPVVGAVVRPVVGAVARPIVGVAVRPIVRAAVRPSVGAVAMPV